MTYKRSVKCFITLILGLYFIANIQITSKAADTVNESLIKAEEYEEIKALEGDMLSQTEDFLSSMEIGFEELLINFAGASKVYVDMDISNVKSTKEKDIMSFLKMGSYVWVIPVDGISSAGDEYVTITVARGLPLNEERTQILTEEEREIIKEQEGNWEITEIGTRSIDSYSNQLEKVKVNIDHYTIVGGIKGLFRPIAIGFEDGEAKYWVSLGYEYEVLSDKTKIAATQEGIYDYDTVKKAIDNYKVSGKLSGGGAGVSNNILNENIVFIGFSVIILIIVIGGAIRYRKR